MHPLCVTLVTLLLVASTLAFPGCFFDGNLDERTLDGTCNNLIPHRQEWGSTNQFYEVDEPEPYPQADVPQVVPLPTYADAATLASSGPRGNGRDISNALFVRPVEDVVDPINHSMFAVMMGQFINHDFENNRFVNASGRDYFPLVTYLLDPADSVCQAQFQNGANQPFRCGPTNRILTSEARFSGSETVGGKRYIYNNATSYLDLNTVYSTDADVNNALRTLVGGRFKTESYNMSIPLFPSPIAPVFNVFIDNAPPSFQTTGIENFNPSFKVGQIPQHILSCGDGRCNENAALQTMHTIWLREHNIQADAVAARNPSWSDERIFQRARAITIAKYQHIIYTQYLPDEFGPHFTEELGDYNHYKVNVNADTLLAFASAAFRYGHSSMNEYHSLTSCGVSTQLGVPNPAPLPFLSMTAAVGPLSLSPPGVIAVGSGYASIIRGLINQHSAPVGVHAPNSLRNLYLGTGVVDLITMDIARARHNQLPNYQTIRAEYFDIKSGRQNHIYGASGCPISLKNQANVNDTLACFEVITGSGSPLAAKLKAVYGKVNLIDPIVGLLAEPHVAGTSFGRSMGNIIVEQYKRARDGDRFFYERLLRNGYFDEVEANEIRASTMGSVLRRAVPGIVVPEDPFVVPADYIATLASSSACTGQ